MPGGLERRCTGPAPPHAFNSAIPAILQLQTLESVHPPCFPRPRRRRVEVVTFFHVSTSASVRGRGQPKDSRLGYPERTRLNSKIDCIVLKWASPCIAAWGPNAGQGRPAAQNSPSAHGVASTRPSQAPPTSAKAFHRSDTPPGLQPAPSRWEAAVGRAAPITRAVRISRTSRGVICPHGPSPLPTSPNRPTRRAPPCHQSNFANIGGSLQLSLIHI